MMWHTKKVFYVQIKGGLNDNGILFKYGMILMMEESM